MVGGAVTTGTVVATVVTGAGAAEVGAGVGATVGAGVVGAGVVGAGVVGAGVVGAGVVPTVVATVIAGGGVTGGIVAGVATVLAAGTVALADADVVGATVPADSASLIEGVDDCANEGLFGEGVLDDDGGVLLAGLLRTVFCAPITGTAVGAIVGFGLVEEAGVSGEPDVGRCAAVVVGRAKVTNGAAGEGTLTVDGGAVDSMRRPVSGGDASSTGSEKSTTATSSNETSPPVGASGSAAVSARCGSAVSADRVAITRGTGCFGATGRVDTVVSAPLMRAS